LIKGTQRFGEERTGIPVPEGEAEELIGNVAVFFDLLAEWDRNANAGQKPPEGDPVD
jgi:hypothetical protein